MNRNNFFIHVALATRSHSRRRFRRSTQQVAQRVEITRADRARRQRKAPMTVEDIALNETRSFGRPEVLVKFKQRRQPGTHR